MSLNMPITRRKIRNHFHYSLWKYLLLIVLALFGWNLLYTTTRYRSPENLKVEFYAEGNTMISDSLQTLTDQVHRDAMPEMEEVTATVVSFDEMYGDMQLTVWVSAGQGDVYLISKKHFENLAGNGATLRLQPAVDSGALQVDGIDLTAGYQSDTETGVRELRGIPADSLTGLSDYGLNPKGMVLCVLLNNGNDEYSLKFLNYLLTHLRGSDATMASPTASATPAVSITPAVTAAPTASPSPTVALTPTPSAAPGVAFTQTPSTTSDFTFTQTPSAAPADSKTVLPETTSFTDVATGAKATADVLNAP